MKKFILVCAAIVCLSGSTAQAQTFGDVQIRLSVFLERPDGGEKAAGLWYLTGPVVIGKPMSSLFSWEGKVCDGWSVSTATDLREDATTAWRVEVTPVRVNRDAVTFRLRWARFGSLQKQTEQFSFDAAKASRTGSEDVELTLRPGESSPVDTVRVPEGAKSIDGRPCGESSSIRVSVEPYPWEGDERRLVGAELWLVERLPNGTTAQRSQPLTVRTLPNHSTSFYFDRIVDGNVSLDVYGVLKPRLASGTIDLDIETRCRWKGPSDRGDFAGPQRSVPAQFGVGPTDIVEVQLPALGDDAGAFAKRKFSIRIRAQQLR